MNISAHNIPKSASKIANAPGTGTPANAQHLTDIIEIRVFSDLREIAAEWKQFETTAIHTVFQTYHWLSTWQQHIGARAHFTPHIVAGYDATGKMLFLLPLAIRRKGILRMLCFMGHDDVSYQLGMFDSVFLNTLSDDTLTRITKQVSHALPDFDVVHFKQQPLDWHGAKNPFVCLPHQLSPNKGHSITLNADYETLYAATRSWKSRSKILRRERNLAKNGEIVCKRCETRQEASRVLDIMFAQKEKRFCEMGVKNFLARPGVQDFFRALAIGDKAELPQSLNLHYYMCGNQMLAAILSAPNQKHEFGLINSISDGPLRNFSPGIHLLHRYIKQLCDEEKKHFDLGVGEQGYKDLWADKQTELFDTLIPVKPLGYVYCGIVANALKAKRIIKNSAVLWPKFQKYRAKAVNLFHRGDCTPVDETLDF